MFRVTSDWLHSLNVVFPGDVNTKVFVLSKLFSTKPEGTVFFFTNQKNVATQSSWLRLLPGDSHAASRPRWRTSQQ